MSIQDNRPTPKLDVAAARERLPEAFKAPAEVRFKRYGAYAAFVLAIVFSVAYLNITFTQFWNGLGQLGFMLPLLFPPSHGGYLTEIAIATFETVAMAFLGTLLAAVISVPLGFLGAKNIIPNILFHFSLRRFFDFGRAIDSLVWALIFVSIVGLGPFAGLLAIAFSDIGTLSKLFAEAIENAEKEQVEGVRATGASGVQNARFGYLPQVFPIMLSHTLYFFESNVRSAAILGIVGAGGLGMILSERIRGNYWDEVCFVVIVILITVAVIDTVSKEVRMRIINDPDKGRI